MQVPVARAAHPGFPGGPIDEVQRLWEREPSGGEVRVALRCRVERGQCTGSGIRAAACLGPDTAGTTCVLAVCADSAAAGAHTVAARGAPAAPAAPPPRHAWTAQPPSPAPARPALASAPAPAAAVAASARSASPKKALIIGGIAILIVLLVGGYCWLSPARQPGQGNHRRGRATEACGAGAMPAPIAPDNTPA